MDGLKVVKVQNLFKPRWYQIRFRFRLWRATRRREKMFNDLSPEALELEEQLSKKIERAFLSGDSNG